MKWIYLVVAIISEVFATSALNESNGFTKFIPAVLTVIGYSVTFYFFSLALREISVGVAYAIWAGIGIVLITIIGYLRFNQKLDVPAIVGIILIAAGVVVINAFSKSISH